MNRKSKKRASPKKLATSSETCFVIMPFGGWFDSYYDEIYAPAITNCGLRPRRADDLFRPSNIVQDIWNHTRKAKIILADLSSKNPNVFYELGLAHALAKPAILITQTIDDVPFDLRGLRIIEYDKNRPDWGGLLMESIQSAISETLLSPNETIPAAFLEITSVSRPSVTKEEKEFLALREDVDILKKEVRSREKENVFNMNEGSLSPGFSNPSFMKPLKPSPKLAKIVGNAAQPRTEVTKKVWDYIKKNRLQDFREKRNINTDDNLKAIFDGKETVSMFEMAKYINANLS